jgi:FtsP/CotA-like multicopper oxidase with cupredoxin domain
MHGSYYRVDSSGDGEHDEIFSPTQQKLVVTRLMPPGTTMSTFWIPPPGRWIFHCHIFPHILPDATAGSTWMQPGQHNAHIMNHMAGMVLGITVRGSHTARESHARVRKLRLLVRERSASNGLPAGFGYQLEAQGKLFPKEPSAPGPPLFLERESSVEITVVNQLREPTTVHWHGIELESYYDGVAGWGMQGDLRFRIPAGSTFEQRVMNGG